MNVKECLLKINSMNFRLGPYTPDELLMYHIEGNNRNCWKRLLMRFAISIVKRFPYLHKMENLVIDYKFHNVAYCSYTKEMHPILTATNGKLRKFVILNEDFEKLNEIIKNREARNDAIDEEELVKLRTDRNQQEIINLNVKLERVQKDADILLSFIKNGFIEVNANISKLTPKSE